MHLHSTKSLRRLLQGSLIIAVLASGSALAGNDPSIKGNLRSNIQAAMDQMPGNNGYCCYQRNSSDEKNLNHGILRETKDMV